MTQRAYPNTWGPHCLSLLTKFSLQEDSSFTVRDRLGEGGKCWLVSLLVFQMQFGLGCNMHRQQAPKTDTRREPNLSTDKFKIIII